MKQKCCLGSNTWIAPPSNKITGSYPNIQEQHNIPIFCGNLLCSTRDPQACHQDFCSSSLKGKKAKLLTTCQRKTHNTKTCDLCTGCKQMCFYPEQHTPSSPSSCILAGSSFQSILCGVSWSHLWHVAPEVVCVNETPLNSMPDTLFLHSVDENMLVLLTIWYARRFVLEHITHSQASYQAQNICCTTQYIYQSTPGWHSTPTSCLDLQWNTKGHMAHCLGFYKSFLEGKEIHLCAVLSPCLMFFFHNTTLQHTLWRYMKFYLEDQAFAFFWDHHCVLCCEVSHFPISDRFYQTLFWCRTFLWTQGPWQCSCILGMVNG